MLLCGLVVAPNNPDVVVLSAPLGLEPDVSRVVKGRLVVDPKMLVELAAESELSAVLDTLFDPVTLLTPDVESPVADNGEIFDVASLELPLEDKRLEESMELVSGFDVVDVGSEEDSVDVVLGDEEVVLRRVEDADALPIEETSEGEVDVAEASEVDAVDAEADVFIADVSGDELKVDVVGAEVAEVSAVEGLADVSGVEVAADELAVDSSDADVLEACFTEADIWALDVAISGVEVVGADELEEVSNEDDSGVVDAELGDVAGADELDASASEADEECVDIVGVDELEVSDAV